MKVLFAGSFDPPSWGHWDIIRRSLKLYDELVIAIAVNVKKKGMFSPEEKEKMVRSLFKRAKIEVVSFDGLLVDLAKKKKVSFLIRGLRNGSDFEQERQMAIANRKLSGIETVFLMADEKYAHISSSLIREIAHFGGSLKEFIPPEVEKWIQKKAPE